MRASVIILLVLTFSACQNRIVNEDFEKDFEFAVQAVDDYYKRQFNEYNEEKYYDEKYHDKYYSIFYNHLLARVYFSLSYLEDLTDIDANITISDPLPCYSSRKECMADIKKWKKWYEENKYNVTKEHSDSIKKLVWNSYIWWLPDDPGEMGEKSFFDDEIVRQQVHNDTLTIVVDSDYLFYPFGKFGNMDDFLKSFPDGTTVSEKRIEKEFVTVSSLRYKNSVINTLSAEIFRNVFLNIEIIDAQIANSEIKTMNGIETGMSRKLFFENFNFPYKSAFDKVRIIETISCYKQIRWYYIFDENDILNEIRTCPY